MLAGSHYAANSHASYDTTMGGGSSLCIGTAAFGCLEDIYTVFLTEVLLISKANGKEGTDATSKAGN